MEKWNSVLASTCNGARVPAESQTEPEITLENYTQFEGVKPPKDYLLKEAEVTNSRLGKLHEEDGYDCELCKNRGYSKKTIYIRDMYRWDNIDVPCVCMEKRNTFQNIEQSGLKDIMEDSRFDNFEVTTDLQVKLKNTALHYIEHCMDETPCRWFFVGGQSGAGKTHICTAISNYFLNNGKTLRYKLWREDGVKAKALLNDAAAYEKELRDWQEPEVLYIDDFFKSGNTVNGVQIPSAADINLAFAVLDHRARNKKAITIISSESLLGEIMRMDGAIGSRILKRTGEKYSINISRDEEKNYRLKQTGMAV